MKDQDKTIEQLTDELAELPPQIAELVTATTEDSFKTGSGQ